MGVVVADTSPLNYLILIEQASLLPALFGSVCVPIVVRSELQHPQTPAPVRRWIGSPLPWLIVRPNVLIEDPDLVSLHVGERNVISLTKSLAADLVIMDDRAGVTIARSKGLSVTRTLGLLELAAGRTLVDLPTAVGVLQTTSFRCHPKLFEALLKRHAMP